MSDLKILDDALGIINDNENDSKDWENISNITDNDDDDNIIGDDLSINPVLNEQNINNNNKKINDEDNEMILINLANDANSLAEAGDFNQAIIIYNDIMERYDLYIYIFIKL